jgi:chromosomal replication initiation ATPase DnaA
MTPLEKATARYQFHAMALADAAKELRALTHVGLPPAARPEIQAIQRCVAQHYRMPVEVLWSRDRHEPYITARLQAIALCRQATELTLVEIGQSFRRDHGCVIHAVRAVESRCETEPRYRAQFGALLAECQRAMAAEVAA